MSSNNQCCESNGDVEEIEYEDVYAVVKGVDDLVGSHESLKRFKTSTDEYGTKFETTYYQTYGGSPEGGYFVRTMTFKDGEIGEQVYSVERTWGTPFECERLGKGLYYHKEDEMAGKVAQVCVH